MTGKVIRNYQITEKIGRGGFGAVYKGIQTNLGREVAVKALHPQYTEDPGFVGKFQAEAKLLAALNHPNIVQVYDIVQEGNTYFIIMEYVKGEPLKEILNKAKKLPAETAIKIITDVGRALSYTHQKNIIHRDIKPANIMVTEDGVAKVMDFGIAKALNEATESFTRIGSFAYAAPEQMNGEPVDSRTDIYALGVTLRHMLAGLPASGDGQPAASPAADADIPDRLRPVILKATAQKKEERFASVAEFLNELQESRQPQTEADKTIFMRREEEKTVFMASTPAPAKAAGQGMPRLIKQPLGLAVGALVVVFAALALFLPSRKASPPSPAPSAVKAGPPGDETASPPDTSAPPVPAAPKISDEDVRLSRQYQERALKHTAKEEWIEAIKNLEKAVELNGENDRAQFELGYAYSQLSGRTKEAVEHMREAVRLNPANAMYKYGLGIVYLNNGEKQKAVQEWEAALAAEPDNPTIQAVLKKYR